MAQIEHVLFLDKKKCVCCCCRFCVLAKCVLHLDIRIAPQPGKSPQKGRQDSQQTSAVVQQQGLPGSHKKETTKSQRYCRVLEESNGSRHRAGASDQNSVHLSNSGAFMLIPLNLHGTGIIPKLKLQPWTHPSSISRVHKLSNWSHLEDHDVVSRNT